MVTSDPAEGDWRWTEGIVDRAREHFQITCGDDVTPVALLGEGSERMFIVQFLPCTGEVLREVRHEIDVYLRERGGDYPWNYAIYHSGTLANFYSNVHWSYFPEGDVAK